MSSNIGNDGIRDLGFHHSGQGAGWHYRISGGHRTDDRFTTRPDSAGIAYVNLRAAYQVNTENSLQLTYRATDVRKEAGEYGSVLTAPRTQFGQNHDLQLRWTNAESSEQET